MRLSKDVVYNLMSRYMMMTIQCQLDLLLILILDVILVVRCWLLFYDVVDLRIFLSTLLDAYHTDVKLRSSLLNVAA